MFYYPLSDSTLNSTWKNLSNLTTVLLHHLNHTSRLYYHQNREHHGNNNIYHHHYHHNNIQGVHATHNDDEMNSFDGIDFNSEALFIFILSILSIPTNICLIIFYAKKIFFYKRYNKNFTPKLRYVYAANCFNTYLIEICSFDTILSIHLLVNTIFKVLHDYEYTTYESIFDVSHFTCKFFVYALRISSSMCAWLTFLLTFNRFMLLFRCRTNNLCINTKYLTLFLFCICTVSNVFRLELLYVNYSDHHQHHNNQFNQSTSQLLSSLLNLLHETNSIDLNLNQTSSNDYDTNDEISSSLNQILFSFYSTNTSSTNSLINNNNNKPQCGVNIGPMEFAISEQAKAVFWSLIAYNIIFAIIPACGNLILSVYLIKKHSQLKNIIILNHLNKKIKRKNKYSCDRASSSGTYATSSISNSTLQQRQQSDSAIKTDTSNVNVNQFIAEFLHTSMPCIAISCMYVICYLPYTFLETLTHITMKVALFKYTMYLNYLRYLFHGCKFYVLFSVSYKFRKDFFKFIKLKYFLKKRNNNNGDDVGTDNRKTKSDGGNCKYNFKKLLVNGDNKNRDYIEARITYL